METRGQDPAAAGAQDVERARVCGRHGRDRGPHRRGRHRLRLGRRIRGLRGHAVRLRATRLSHRRRSSSGAPQAAALAARHHGRAHVAADPATRSAAAAGRDPRRAAGAGALNGRRRRHRRAGRHRRRADRTAVSGTVAQRSAGGYLFGTVGDVDDAAGGLGIGAPLGDADRATSRSRSTTSSAGATQRRRQLGRLRHRRCDLRPARCDSTFALGGYVAAVEPSERDRLHLRVVLDRAVMTARQEDQLLRLAAFARPAPRRSRSGSARRPSRGG